MFKKFRPVEKKVVEEVVIKATEEHLQEKDIIDINQPKHI